MKMMYVNRYHSYTVSRERRSRISPRTRRVISTKSTERLLSYINPTNAKGSCARNAIGGLRGSIQVSDATRRNKVLRRMLKKRAGTELPESRGAETKAHSGQRYYALRCYAARGRCGGKGGGGVAWIVNKSRSERTSVGPRAVLGRARCG